MLLLALALALRALGDSPADRIAVSRLTDGHWQIWTVAPDGSDPRALTSGPTDKRDPCWSPDGRSVLYADHQGKLFRIDREGGEPEPLLTTQAPIAEPHLSIDGRLAYLRVIQGPGYQVEVWSTNLDGSDRRLLTERGLRQLQPAWSPDGRRLAVAQYDTLADVHSLAIVGAKGGTPERWWAGRSRVSDPSWSPDGRHVAFALDTRGNNDIWVASEGSSEQLRLTFEPGLDASPTFSPDGRDVAFISRRSGSLQLWIVPARGGTPRRVTAGDAPCREPAWSPRRRHPTLTLGAARVAPRTLDSRAAEDIEVSFELGEPARVTVEVEELATGAVREHASEGLLEPGPHVVLLGAAGWGERLAPGLHAVRVRASNEGGTVVWDPTEETGGTSVSVERLALVDEQKHVAFHVPTPSFVRVRVGLDAGPLLATPMDWTPMPPGHATVDYAGELPRGWAGFWDQPDRYAWVAAYSLPENVLLVQGPDGDVGMPAPEHSLFRGTSRELFMHAGHSPRTCRDPGVVATITSDRNVDGVPVVANSASIRVDAVDAADRALLETTRFEVMVYVDGHFLMEDEDSALPFHYTLDTSKFPEGHHAFLVNVGGYQDHLGAAFVPFQVERGEQ